MGLSAACGFRIFVPLLGVSLAATFAHLPLAPGMEWLASRPALIGFATATVLEVAAYYVPWLDHVLDVVGVPVALAAGTLLTASQLGDSSPLLKWSLALIGGGGVSAAIHSGTTLARAASTSATGGLGNPVVATLEFLASIAVTLLAMLVPIVCFAGVIWILIVMFQRLGKRRAIETG
jgi:hypothetical protein